MTTCRSSCESTYLVIQSNAMPFGSWIPSSPRSCAYPSWVLSTGMEDRLMVRSDESVQYTMRRPGS